MSDHLQKSIDELTERLRDQEKKVSDTKRAINALCQALGEAPRYVSVDPEQATDTTVRPDSFYGKAFATAVEEILRKRGHAVTTIEIIQTLKDGGYDFDGRDPNRAVPISLAKNTAKFVSIPNTDSFGLKEWYPDLKKRGRKGKDDSELDSGDSRTVPEEGGNQ